MKVTTILMLAKYCIIQLGTINMTTSLSHRNSLVTICITVALKITIPKIVVM